MARIGLRRFRGAFTAGVGLAALALSGGVHAQTVTPQPVNPGAGTPQAGKPTPDSSTLGEIVVTAQKRSENIEHTATAVTAFSASQIAQSGLTGPQQLQFNVPSMTYGQLAGFTFITLRGIGSDIATTAGGQTSVATYLDGVYTGGLISASVPNFDLQRIEVLRGPQGTLYGRNATGGVINYISNPPSTDPGGYVSVSYGNYNSTSDDVGITGPIASDVLTGRLNLHYGEHDGYRYNPYLNDHEDADHTYSARGTILYKPNNDFSIALRGDYSHDHSTPPFEFVSQATLSGGVSQLYPLGVFSLPAASLPAGALSPSDLASLNGGSIASKFGLLQPGPQALAPNHSGGFVATDPTSFMVRSGGTSGTIDWNAGPVTVKSITAWRYSSQFWYLASPEASDSPARTTSRQFTQEFDVSGKGFDDRLTWLAGAYYLRDDASYAQTIYVANFGQYYDALHSFTNPGFNTSLPAGPNNPEFSLAGGYDTGYYSSVPNLYSTVVIPTVPYGGPSNAALLQPNVGMSNTAFIGFDAQQLSQSVAGFSQATFKITPALRLTGGARFTVDPTRTVRTLHSNFLNTLFGLGPGGLDYAAALGDLCDHAPEKHKWSAPTGTVGLDYDAAAHVLTYAKVAWGYKSGGFNVGSCSGHFNPEYLTDYEGGIKAVWLDGQLLTNLASYYYKYNDIQFTTYIQNTSAILNAGKATAFGVELEYALRPHALPGFQIDGSMSYEDSKYGAGCFQDPASLLQPAPVAGQTVCANPGEQIKGKELIRAPRWKTNVGAQYTTNLGSSGTVTLRGDAAWTDKIYNDIFNGTAPDEADVTQNAYWVVNAHLVWVSPTKRYEAEIFGNNITNSLYSTSRTGFNTPTTVDTVGAYFAAPATYGVRVTLRFGSEAH